MMVQVQVQGHFQTRGAFSALACAFTREEPVKTLGCFPDGLGQAYSLSALPRMQGMGPGEYEAKKVEVADALVARVEAFLPGLAAATVFRHALPDKWHPVFLSALLCSLCKKGFSHHYRQQGGGHAADAPALPGARGRQLRAHPRAPPAGHAGHALQPYRHQGARRGAPQATMFCT